MLHSFKFALLIKFRLNHVHIRAGKYERTDETERIWGRERERESKTFQFFIYESFNQLLNHNGYTLLMDVMTSLPSKKI